MKSEAIVPLRSHSIVSNQYLPPERRKSKSWEKVNVPIRLQKGTECHGDWRDSNLFSFYMANCLSICSNRTVRSWV